jgi:hypothetical protein
MATRFRIHACLCILLTFTLHTWSQSNLIANGDFASDSGWNLGLYEGGQATGKVESNTYTIDITNGGSVPWAIQFTRPRIQLDSNSAYIFSCSIASSVSRTVEISLSRDGGDYGSYSGRDTVTLTSTAQKYERLFIMKNSSDSNTRLEFNCGKALGKISIQNVKLVKFTDRVLKVIRPRSNELLTQGIPYSIEWTSLNINSPVRIDLSSDNGATWKPLGSAQAASGVYRWTPGTTYSPWCRIRVVSEDDTVHPALNEGTFECAPRSELVANSSFRSPGTEWSLGVYGGKATGAIQQDSIYRIAIEQRADDYWQIQLSQSGIPLVKGKAYRLTCIASADSATGVYINIGTSAEPYVSYLDTAKWIVTLSTKPQLFSVVFTMDTASDSSARIEFNCGKSAGAVYIDALSLVPEYVASAGQAAHSVPMCRAGMSRSIRLAVGRSGTSFAHAGTRQLFDLRGRILGRAATGTGPGVYIVRTTNADR